MSRTIKRSVDDRKGIIGGSSLGATLGLSKYQSKHDVWLAWKGEEREVSEEKQAIFDMGHALEDFIAKQAEKKYNVKVKKTSNTYVHPEYEWLICHPDRLVVGRIDGKRVGMEIKSSSSYDNNRWGDEDTSEVPMDYLCQCHDYIMCDVCDVVWLIRFSNNRLTRYIIDKDESLEEMILSQAVEEMEKWQKGIEPPIEDYDEAREYYKDDTRASVEATEEIAKLVDEIKEKSAQKNTLEDEIKKAKALIISFMQDKEVLTDHFGTKLMSYTKVKKEGFDLARFKAENPDMYGKYIKDSSYMTLR